MCIRFSILAELLVNTILFPSIQNSDPVSMSSQKSIGTNNGVFMRIFFLNRDGLDICCKYSPDCDGLFLVVRVLWNRLALCIPGGGGGNHPRHTDRQSLHNLMTLPSLLNFWTWKNKGKKTLFFLKLLVDFSCWNSSHGGSWAVGDRVTFSARGSLAGHLETLWWSEMLLCCGSFLQRGRSLGFGPREAWGS